MTVQHSQGLPTIQSDGVGIGAAKEPELNSLLVIACKVFDVPLATVRLAACRTLWFHASTDTVDHAVLLADRLPDVDLVQRPLIVEDTAEDRRFEGKYVGSGGDPVRFYAGVPIWLEAGIFAGTLCLLDSKPRRLAANEAELLAAMVKVVAGLIREPSPGRAVHGLAQDQTDKVRLPTEERARVARFKSMYDRSSIRAKIGAWECNLENEELTWTDGVYDIFELPRGSPITRSLIVGFYYKSSLREMERLRRKAIQECCSVGIDVRIRTAKGNKRWMRLSVDVECEGGSPARIFGLKQDVTEEKELWDRMRQRAECDPLTGLANRGVFEAKLLKSLGPPVRAGALSALVLVDLDGFKMVNDTFGHAAGDECLRQVADRLRSVFRRAALVARIGGDEFAVVLCGSRDPVRIATDAKRLIAELRAPASWCERPFDLGASVGIAVAEAQKSYTPSQIFAEADAALYAAKKSGRNLIRIFQPDVHPVNAPACSALTLG